MSELMSKKTFSQGKVTIIIPVWNSGCWISDCLAGLRRQTYTDFVLLLVDNGSTDGSLEEVDKHGFREFHILSFEQNMGFSVAVNAGIRQATTRYVALLNIDTVPEPGWLENLVMAMDNAPVEVTSLASKMLNMSNSEIIDSAGDILSWYGSAFKRGNGQRADMFKRPTEVFSACAGAALYRKSFFDEVGCFDENFHSYFEDVDLGFREKLYGYRCLYVPNAVVLHHGHSAGVFGPYYVFLLTRNRLLTLVKNVPGRCLIRHIWQLLYGQVHFFIIYRRPLASLKGYLSALFLLPVVLVGRKKIQAGRRISIDNLEHMIRPGLGEVSFMERIRRRIVCR